MYLYNIIHTPFFTLLSLLNILAILSHQDMKNCFNLFNACLLCNCLGTHIFFHSPLVTDFWGSSQYFALADMTIMNNAVLTSFLTNASVSGGWIPRSESTLAYLKKKNLCFLVRMFMAMLIQERYWVLQCPNLKLTHYRNNAICRNMDATRDSHTK